MPPAPIAWYFFCIYKDIGQYTTCFVWQEFNKLRLNKATFDKSPIINFSNNYAGNYRFWKNTDLIKTPFDQKVFITDPGP